MNPAPAPWLRLLRALPAEACWTLGACLGWAFGSLPLRDPARARTHLARAYPTRPQAWIRATTCRCFAHFAACGLWTLATLHRRPRRDGPLVSVRPGPGFAAMITAATRGEGTLICSAHLGNWELLARWTGRHAPVTVLGRPMRSALAAAIVQQLRTSTGNQQIDQDAGILALARELRRGRLMATLPDQDISRLAGCFVPWFGHPAWTPSGPAAVAALARAPIQGAVCQRVHGRWLVTLSPRRQIDSFPGSRPEQIAAATAWVTAWLEARVRERPWQWVWWHKRWRTQPKDKPGAVVVGGGVMA